MSGDNYTRDPRDPREVGQDCAHKDDSTYLARSIEVKLELAVQGLVERVQARTGRSRRDAALLAVQLIERLT